MSHDFDELGHVSRVLNEALALLKSERKRLEQQYQGQAPGGDMHAGSPSQTLHGVNDMVKGLRDTLDSIALHAGYASLGLTELANRTREQAYNQPLSTYSGVDRMARPLGEATVRALRLLRELDNFFQGDVAAEIDEALAAPQATYPPTDWEAYHKEAKRKMREKAGRL